MLRLQNTSLKTNPSCSLFTDSGSENNFDSHGLEGSNASSLFFKLFWLVKDANSLDAKVVERCSLFKSVGVAHLNAVDTELSASVHKCNIPDRRDGKNVGESIDEAHCCDLSRGSPRDVTID